MNWERLLELARTEVTRTMAELPGDLRQRAAALPVSYERVPDRGVVEEGTELETLGLFVGGEFVHEDDDPIPPQIILYLENIWEMVEGDEAEFVEEVHITFIHELGHYLGLTEEDLEERGLL